MKKINIIIILLVSISLVTFKYTWRNRTVHHLPHAEKIVSSKALKDSVKIEDKKINAETKVLHRINDSLSKQLVHTKLLYEQSQAKVKLLQAALKQLIAKDTTKNVAQRMLNCDSIKHDAELLIAQHTDSDTLCEQRECELETVIQNKNTEISLAHEHYNKLKTDFSIALQQQDYLQKDNLHLFKTAQRKTFSNKILKTGIVVLAGFTAALIIQPHL